MKLTSIRLISEKREKDFNKLGIFEAEDLVRFYPRAYLDLTARSSLRTEMCIRDRLKAFRKTDGRGAFFARHLRGCFSFGGRRFRGLAKNRRRLSDTADRQSFPFPRGLRSQAQFNGRADKSDRRFGRDRRSRFRAGIYRGKGDFCAYTAYCKNRRGRRFGDRNGL